jgi:biopolymer transport protein ExbD
MALHKHRRAKPAAIDEPVADINTTPLIDVMLVLLIMLIITIPIQLHSVNLNMPTGNPPPSAVTPEVVRIDIDAAGKVLWNGQVIGLHDDLERLMTEQANRPVQPEVHLRPDRKARYDIVASVLASAQRIGLSKIGVIGSEQFAQ